MADPTGILAFVAVLVGVLVLSAFLLWRRRPAPSWKAADEEFDRAA